MTTSISNDRHADGAALGGTAVEVRGASEHNLRRLDLDLPHDRLIAVTGVSGSGKSSLAFDTLYAEARRRFLLTAGGAAGAFAERLQPPRAARLDGLRPALAIAQARQRPSARSTAATVTGIADYLRLLFARVGQPHCVACGAALHVQPLEEVCELIAGRPEGTRLLVLAPLAQPVDAEAARRLYAAVERGGYRRVRVDGETRLLEELQAGALRGRALEVVVDRVVVKGNTRRRLQGSLQAAAEAGDGRLVVVDADSGAAQGFSVRPCCGACGVAFPEVTPALFSFNGPAGACPACRGTGLALAPDWEGMLPPEESPLAALAPLWERFGHARLRRQVEAYCRRAGVDPETPLGQWPRQAAQDLWAGRLERPSTRGFAGLKGWLETRLAAVDEPAEAGWLEDLAGGVQEAPCASCGGARLAPAALAVRLDGLSVADLTALTAAAAAARLGDLDLPVEQQALADHILAAVRQALAALLDLGLGYLTLDRRARTLSAGELQRLHLVAALGSGLSRVMYVLDEPSAGLHARDTARLAASLRRLRDRGNTVIVVEHDLDLIRQAEIVVELGPGAGAEGGRLVALGAPAEVAAADTPTGRCLAGATPAAARERAAGSGGWLRLRGARGHNLKDIDVDLPLGCLVCISGVSGSGKSSLVNDTLAPALAARLQGGRRRPLPHRALEGAEALERVVSVDQAPIGRTSRSNAATYTGLLATLRALFAELPEARLRGYRPGHFSFNRDGACDACHGSGLDPEAAGYDDLPLPCPTCGGRRYRREVLEIRFRQHSIADVLSLSVNQALEVFANVPAAAQRLRFLAELGLGYLHLGQPAHQLSGGEAQRVKLAGELGRPLQERTLYLLDEPTSGLHPQDVGHLLELLQRLVDRGNTVLVVEHELAVIAAADHVIDLGPEAGQDGGEVVVAGAPSLVAACAASHTGGHLAAWLAGAV